MRPVVDELGFQTLIFVLRPAGGREKALRVVSSLRSTSYSRIVNGIHFLPIINPVSNSQINSQSLQNRTRQDIAISWHSTVK